jgi:hypothetical protein
MFFEDKNERNFCVLVNFVGFCLRFLNDTAAARPIWSMDTANIDKYRNIYLAAIRPSLSVDMAPLSTVHCRVCCWRYQPTLYLGLLSVIFESSPFCLCKNFQII